jgi:hypothetical protein
MEREDYLMKQINQLGRVLSKIFVTILNLKNNGKLTNGLEVIDQSLKTEVDFDLEKIISLPDEDFIRIITKDRKFNTENLEKLAELLFVTAKNSCSEKTILKKCLVIYNFIEIDSKTFSIGRQNKMNEINKLLR